jgi:hypothetical protein
MAKKELNFGKLGLPPKPTMVKQVESTEPLIEKAVEIIHREVAKPSTPSVTAPTVAAKPNSTPAHKTTTVSDLEAIAAVKKVSMDLPLDIYKYLKTNAFDQGISMKDFVVRLVEREMNGGQ